MADRPRKTEVPPPDAAEEEPTATPRHDPAICGVAFCPVSMLLTATGTVSPEVVEHLLAAGRELLLAAQVVINARAESMGRTSPLEHIEIG
ncbi:MAG: hypothetical protein LC722_04730 [Actinobacteria bacterium]|nr:hypothetical protein [Actinomycetota bacterium]